MHLYIIDIIFHFFYDNNYETVKSICCQANTNIIICFFVLLKMFIIP